MINKQYNTATQSRVENTDNKNAQNAQKKETKTMAYNIQKKKDNWNITKDEEMITVRLSEDCNVKIVRSDNNRFSIDVTHHETSSLDTVRLDELTTYATPKSEESKTSWSSASTVFEDRKTETITEVSHTAFNKWVD